MPIRTQHHCAIVRQRCFAVVGKKRNVDAQVSWRSEDIDAIAVLWTVQAVQQSQMNQRSRRGRRCGTGDYYHDSRKNESTNDGQNAGLKNPVK